MDEEAPLIAERSDNKTTTKNHTRDIHILSSAFLFIFLAYGAAQNLESTINTEADLGTISLGILYSSFTVFSLVASLVVRSLGSKNALVLGTTGYWLFIAANLWPSWAEFTKYIVEPALGISGVGGAMAAYGAVDAICALTVGRFTSGLKAITLIVSAGAFIQFIVLLWLLLKYSVTSGVLGTLFPLLIAAAWGITNGVFNTQLSALVGMLFKHDMEGAFAQLKVWQSGSIAVVFFLSPYITLRTMLVVLLAAVCISVAAFLFLTLQVEKAFSSAA
ncbi:UNC93-like protein [Actinidia chinensis var. chinensis]|uniref:UNC93-like protein n=1 Tax=Actinidia chinensis var. chinensis TaxID=1590841 RepID=A0A2R6QKG3_ACTCC|nr:UNC93-like protein [Actinidia chinensis var. chinensis]